MTSEQKLIADLHAQADWRQGLRWRCTCAVCQLAMAERYEPRGTNWLLQGGNDGR